jgi:hypothetical protein
MSGRWSDRSCGWGRGQGPARFWVHRAEPGGPTAIWGGSQASSAHDDCAAGALWLVVGCAGLLSACSGGANGAAAPTSTVTVTATATVTVTATASVTASPSPTTVAPAAGPSWVVAPERCGALAFGVDGNISPATCPDGRPNLAADVYLRAQRLRVMSLGADASPDQVLHASVWTWLEARFRSRRRRTTWLKRSSAGASE